jgi:hypothetical protein
MMTGPDGDAFWLNFTNIALGLITLFGVIVVAAGVVRELGHRLVHGKRLADDHSFETPGLGVTMADGGERVERK